VLIIIIIIIIIFFKLLLLLLLLLYDRLRDVSTTTGQANGRWQI